MVTNTLHEALYYEKLEKNNVRCELCPHRCIIGDGKSGICNVRKNISGKLYSLVYGKVSSMAMDPIEKKPLFHFHPGSWIFSLSTIGCNLKCKHCQNWEISQATIERFPLRNLEPDDVVGLALEEGSSGIAWTYNEPTIWIEFNLEVSKIAKKKGLYGVYVTNGYITEEPLKELSKYIDAMNIDVKGFTDEFYRKIVAGRLEPVLETVSRAKSLGMHVEITYLIIPTLNDNKEEIRKFSKWAYDTLGENAIVHFSRFHPDYQLMHLNETPMETMLYAYNIAREEGINFVYLGNVWDEKFETTYCPNCGTPLIKRSGYKVKIENLNIDGTCKICGKKIPIIGVPH
ncbi:MAG: AmmeMemoRadiSam system radical SAM enzyme [Thermoplasmata archaeon]